MGSVLYRESGTIYSWPRGPDAQLGLLIPACLVRLQGGAPNGDVGHIVTLIDAVVRRGTGLTSAGSFFSSCACVHVDITSLNEMV